MKLASWSWIPLVILVILTLLGTVAVVIRSGPSVGTVTALGGIALWSLVFLGIAKVVHVFSRRSNTAASIAFVIGPSIMLIVIMALVPSRINKLRAGTNATNAITTHNRNIEQAALQGDTSTIRKELAGIASAAQQLEQSANKEDKALGRVLRELAHRQSAMLATYQAATKPLDSEDFYDPAKLTKESDFREHIASVELAKTANEVFRNEVQGLVTEMRESLRASGISATRAEELMRISRIQERIAASESMRQTEHDLYVAIRNRFVLLQKSKSRWSIEGATLAFEQDKDLRQYNTLTDRIQYLVAENEKQQREFIAKFN